MPYTWLIAAAVFATIGLLLAYYGFKTKNVRASKISLLWMIAAGILLAVSIIRVFS